MQKDLLPVLEAPVENFVVFYHLVGFIDSAHVAVVVRNCLRSGNSDPATPIILYAILGISCARSMMVSSMKGAH